MLTPVALARTYRMEPGMDRECEIKRRKGKQRCLLQAYAGSRVTSMTDELFDVSCFVPDRPFPNWVQRRFEVLDNNFQALQSSRKTLKAASATDSTCFLNEGILTFDANNIYKGWKTRHTRGKETLRRARISRSRISLPPKDSAAITRLLPTSTCAPINTIENPAWFSHQGKDPRLADRGAPLVSAQELLEDEENGYLTTHSSLPTTHTALTIDQSRLPLEVKRRATAIESTSPLPIVALQQQISFT